MSLKTKLISTLVLASSVIPMAQAASGIPQAVGIYLTPSGQDLMNSELQTILKSIDYDLSKGRIAEKTTRFDEPFTAARIKKMLAGRKDGKKSAQTFEMVSDLFHAWLKGIELRAPRVSVQIKELNYTVNFDHLGFRLNPEATAKAGSKALAFEFKATTSSVEVNLGQLRLIDRANTFLNPLGLLKPSLVIPRGAEPLTVTLPFVLKIVNHKPQIQFFPATSNIGEVAFDLRFGTLELPEISLTFSDEEDPNDVPTQVKLNRESLNREIRKIEPALVRAIQDASSGFIANEAHIHLNELALKELEAYMNPQTVSFPAPGGPTGEAAVGKDGPLTLTAGLSDLSRQGKNLYLGVTALAEDPTRETALASPQPAATSAPALPAFADTAKPGAPEIWAAINQTILNQVFKLAYDRGYNKKIDIGEGFYITMVQPPTIHFNGKYGADRAPLHVRARYVMDRGRIVPIPVVYPVVTMVPVPVPGSDWDWFATRGALEIDFDVLLKIENDGKKIRIIKEKVDLNSIQVDKKGIRFAGDKVRENVLGRFTNANKGMAEKPEVAFEADLPNEVLGLDFKLGTMIQKDGFQWIPVYLRK